MPIIIFISDSDDPSLSSFEEFILSLVPLYPSIDWEILDMATQIGADLAEYIGVDTPTLIFLFEAGLEALRLGSNASEAEVLTAISVIAPLKVYYLRADYCGPCQIMDPQFLPDSQGVAGLIPNAFFTAMQEGKVQFLLADVTTQQNQAYYQSYFGQFLLPSVILRRGGREIARVNGVNPDPVVQAIIAEGIEADPLDDIAYDVYTNLKKRNPIWLFILLGSLAIAKQKQNQ